MSRMLWPTELRARMRPSFRAVTSPSAANPRFYPKGRWFPCHCLTASFAAGHTMCASWAVMFLVPESRPAA